MKRFLALTLCVLSLALCIGFTACKDEEKEDTNKKDSSIIGGDGWTGNY